MTLSAHKLGGPKGVGALIKASEDIHLAEPMIRGGGQERGARAGTENVMAIAGFGAAAQAATHALAEEARRVSALRERLEAGLVEISPDAKIFGRDLGRLPNTTLFAVPGVRAETALIALDLDGIAVSSGSACSSGKVAPSHVLKAMGVDADLAAAAVRISLGFGTSMGDVESFLFAWNRFIRSLPKRTESIAA
jgi:cysteine desulfurase